MGVMGVVYTRTFKKVAEDETRRRMRRKYNQASLGEHNAERTGDPDPEKQIPTCVRIRKRLDLRRPLVEHLPDRVLSE